MASSKDVTGKQRGPFVYCLLDGLALETVEHVTLEKLQEESGDRYLWEVLDERFPDKQQHDWLAECLREVFQVTVNEGESMTSWTSRVQEVFSKCKRKVAVDFPTEARGWICLNASGLSEDQRAIVTAKTQGDLKLDTVIAAMRSCFPDYKASAKASRSRGYAAYVAEDDSGMSSTTAPPEDNFADFEFNDPMVQEVECFLADYGIQEDGGSLGGNDTFEEREVAEILAASWKEKRAEISRLQRSRKWTQASMVKKQFSREASELKAKSKCWNCLKVGHWSRDCTAPRRQSPSSSTADSKVHGAAVATCLTVQEHAEEALLISSPGYGIVDSGCSKTLIGQETLNDFMRLFHKFKIPVPETQEESNLFRFGNGSEEWSERTVRMPVGIFGKRGVVTAAIIKGSAPLLLSRATMAELRTILDFDAGTISILGAPPQKMKHNEAGQIILDMLEFEVNPVLIAEDILAEHSAPHRTLTKRERRVVLSQQAAWSKSDSKCLVAELFSPPRFAKTAEEMGARGVSFDLQQGWDLTTPSVQREVSQRLEEECPELLVVCPECKHWGGWYRLNQHRLPMEVRLRNMQYAKKQVDFCVQEIKNQIRRGGRVMIEHPWSSNMWQYGPMSKVTKNMHKCRADLCAYGLTDDEGVPILKPTAIMVSHEDMKQFAETCPGHQHHRVVAGKLGNGENVSSSTARYTPKFCKQWLKCVSPSNHVCAFSCLEESSSSENSECLHPVSQDHSAEVLATSLKVVASDKEVKQSLTKLHNNLGHPSDRDLIRILKNAGASSQALSLAANFEKQCDVCVQKQRPTPCLPASPSQTLDFNHRIGMDVKRLPGWQVNQQVKCLNIVDYASSFQVMLPFYEVEKASVLRRLYQEGWLRWAGPPVELLLDAATTNMAESMIDPLEQSGTRVMSIAAEAHNQLGKVEKHGHLFENILVKVLEQVQPQNREEYEACLLQTANSKNELISVKGLSPCQLVFGRNPRVPEDLLQDWPCPIAATSPLHDDAHARSRDIRAAARMALIMSQDDKTLRTALNARPRVDRDFLAGDFVCYWRSQKYQRGIRLVGGRWYGVAIIMGKIGRNYLVFHRKNMFKVAPEHLRHATQDERLAAQTDGRELLGIDYLIEKGKSLLGNQFVDLTHQDTPPTAVQKHERPAPTEDFWIQRGQLLCRVHVEPRTKTFMPDPNDSVVKQFHLDNWRLTSICNNCQLSQDEFIDFPWTIVEQQVRELQTEPWTGESRFWILAENKESRDAQTTQIFPTSLPSALDTEVSTTANTTDDNKVVENNEPFPTVKPSAPTQDATYGPVRVRQSHKGPDTFLFRPQQTQVEDFQDAIQEMAEERSAAHKRASSREPSTGPPEKAPRTELTEDENLMAELVRSGPHVNFEVFLATFLKKKQQKELHHSNNPETLQALIDDSKRLEWETLQNEKGAITVIPPHEAALIRKSKPDRIMSSRFVITEKHEDNSTRVKSRWCLRGHHDPDLIQKVVAGKCHSPTLAQLSRSLILQLLVSFKWSLNLGDIKGAFLEANVKDQALANPVYAELPPGGVPGISAGSLVQILGNIYGANDAPANWYHEFDSVATSVGFTKSKFDNCLYWCYGPGGDLQGVLGAHVDDTITGGSGQAYDRAIQLLKQRFPFRKWRVGSGEFLGTQYTQDPESFEIRYNQKSYAESLKPISVSRERARKYWLPATPKEIASLRAVNGALGWLSSQSRPDLAVQTSMSQQAFPVPTVQDLLLANQAVRRARQQSDLEIVVPYVHPNDLTVVFWSDAAFANTLSMKTQGGWLVAFTSKEFSSGQDVPVHCTGWRSYRLPRVVSSTLSGEAQSFAVASGIAEWLLLMVAEGLDGQFSLTDVDQVLKRRKPIGVSDCRSLYDHLNSLGSGGTIDDKRTAIDIAIIRQSIQRSGLEPRWCPTTHMVADAFTKDKAEPIDLLRSIIRQHRYQLADEQTVLDRKQEEKLRRQQKAHDRSVKQPTPEVSEQQTWAMLLQWGI